MDCRDIERRLPELIDRKLSPDESHDVTAHLMTCETCESEYLRLRETHRVLTAYGAVASPADTPEFPAVNNGFIRNVTDWLTFPVPVWAPAIAAACVIALLIPASPVSLPIQWGAEKGVGGESATRPPGLSAQAMLEYLIEPDTSDANQLIASVQVIETFLETHPDDIAMRAKLIELYRHQLTLPNLNDDARREIESKLTTTRERFHQLLNETGLDNASN